MQVPIIFTVYLVLSSCDRGEVQCIMGKVHMEPPKQDDRHDWKHYLPVSSLAGGKNCTANKMIH